jgi:ankyrin repeat protein
MTINSLYFFIKTEFSSLIANTNLNPDSFSFMRSKEKAYYALYDIPVKQKIVVTTEAGKKYKLESQHISFYEKQNDDALYRNDYHYTAYFVDLNGSKYQLHVYFNQKDLLTVPPVFSLIDENKNMVTQHVCVELSESLKQLAIEKTFLFMIELRKQYKNKLTLLETSYNILENQLSDLSLKLEDNLKPYQEKLKECISILSQLSHYDYNHYSSVLMLFKNIDLSFKSRKFLLTSEKTTEKNQSLNINEIAHNDHCVEIIDNIVKQESLDKVVETIASSKEKYLNEKEDNIEEKIKFFLKFHHNISDVLLLTEDERYLTTTTHLQEIQSALSYRKKEGGRLVTNLLLKNKFDLTLPLRDYLNPMPENLVRIALMTGNDLLLDFLLTHAALAINTFLVKENLSPVLFCFLKHSPATPKIKCLSVLIKHNASIMVAADDGLPVAHHIMSKNHPLHEAFVDQYQLTLCNVMFYKMLIQKINDFLLDDEITQDTREKIAIAINGYKIEQKCIGKSSIEKYAIKQKNKKVLDISRQYSEATMAKLNNNKEYKEKIAELNRVSVEYFSKLSSAEKRMFNRLNLEGLNNLNEVLKFINTEDIQDLESQAILHVDKMIQNIRLESELLDLKRFVSLERSSKKIAKAKQRLVILIRELEISHQDNDSALISAAQRGNLAQVKYFTSLPATNINALTIEGATACFMAAQHGYLEILQFLCLLPNIRLDTKLHCGTTMLFMACQQGHVEIVKHLISFPSILQNINMPRPDGCTVLHIAVQQGHLKTVQFLASITTIDLNVVMADGNTILEIAISQGRSEIFKYLTSLFDIKRLTAAQTNGITLFFLAAQVGNLEIIKHLTSISGIDLNAPTADGGTAFLIACQLGHQAIVEYLTSLPNMNQRAKLTNNTTAFALAAEFEHLAVAKYLASLLDPVLSYLEAPLMITSKIPKIIVDEVKEWLNVTKNNPTALLSPVADFLALISLGKKYSNTFFKDNSNEFCYFLCANLLIKQSAIKSEQELAQLIDKLIDHTWHNSFFPAANSSFKEALQKVKDKLVPRNVLII